MTPSRFNIVVPYTDQTKVLVNTLTGALDVVNSNVADYLAAPLCETACEETAFLSARGYLLEDSCTEQAVDEAMYPALLAAERSRTSLQAVLILSFNCNLCCCYCWQQHRVVGKVFPIMSFEQADKALEAARLLQEMLPDTAPGPVYVRLFGGEPLIREHYELVEHILKWCAERDYPVGITTNGFELPYYQRLLEIHPVQELQITVDGDEQTHNSRRIGSDWNVLLDSVNKLIWRTNTIVKIRVNLDETVLSVLPTLANEIIDRSWYGTSQIFCYVAPLRDVSMTSTKVLSKRVDLLQRFLSMQKEMPQLECFHLLGWDGFHVLDSLIRTKRMPIPHASMCDINRGQFVFDPDGSIHLCSEETMGSWDIVGSYYPEFKFDEGRFNEIYDHKAIDDALCRDCALRPLCGGGCNLFHEYPEYRNVYCQVVWKTFVLAIQEYVDEIVNEENDK
jgi:uncharacterized protein